MVHCVCWGDLLTVAVMVHCVCWGELTDSSSYGSCVLDRTD